MIDDSVNFWVKHPSLKLINPFKDLFKNDKSRAKERSSRLMWCIVYIWDRQSEFYNLPEEGEDGKINLVFTDIYEDKSYYKKNEELIQTLKVFYLRTTESVAMRSLRIVENSMEDRAQMLAQMGYKTLDDFTNDVTEWKNYTTMLDTLLKNTPSIYEGFDKARKLVNEEIDKTSKGNEQDSLSDSGEI